MLALRPRPRAVAGPLVLALVASALWGCGGTGVLPSPSAPAVTEPASATSAPPTAAPDPTPVPPTPAAIPGAPPDVALAAGAASPVVGDLGTYSWDGLVSDSPWILGRASVSVAAGDTLEASVAGDLPVGDWTARWAHVEGGTPMATGEGAADGHGAPIMVRAPGPGSWSLRVEVRSGDVGRANWYWRVSVAP